MGIPERDRGGHQWGTLRLPDATIKNMSSGHGGNRGDATVGAR